MKFFCFIFGHKWRVITPPADYFTSVGVKTINGRMKCQRCKLDVSISTIKIVTK